MAKLLTVILLLLSSCAQPQHPLLQRDEASTRAQLAPILAEDGDAKLTSVGDSPQSKKSERRTWVGIYNNPQFTPLVDLIEAAQSTIDIEIYQMEDHAFREALRRALKNHVRIQLVAEPAPLGGTCPLFTSPQKDKKLNSNCLDLRKLVKEINDAGGKAVAFDKKALCGQAGTPSTTRCFEHGKMVIVDRDLKDRRLALISSGNFNASNLCDLAQHPSVCNRDYSYVTRDDEVISALSRIFASDLKSERLDQKTAALTSKITVSPYTKTALVDFINSATTSIQIENQYMQDPDVNAAIEAKAKHVQVEMMVASLCSFGTVTESQAKKAKANYSRLTDAGVKLRFFSSAIKVHGKRGYLHAKAIVIDERLAWVGSVNGSSESMDANREYGIFFDHPDRVHFLSSIMAADFDDPSAETLSETLACKYEHKRAPKNKRPATGR